MCVGFPPLRFTQYAAILPAINLDYCYCNSGSEAGGERGKELLLGRQRWLEIAQEMAPIWL
jgi:hypothetical protein